jgi:hypothetical protein
MEEILSAKYNYYAFESKIPIPAYLIAIAAGALSIQKVGGVSSRAYVISEPSMINLAT